MREVKPIVIWFTIQFLFTILLIFGIISFVHDGFEHIETSNTGIAASIFMFFSIIERILIVSHYIIKKFRNIQSNIYIPCSIINGIMILCTLYLTNKTVAEKTCDDLSEDPLMNSPLICTYAKTIPILYISVVLIMCMWLIPAVLLWGLVQVFSRVVPTDIHDHDTERGLHVNTNIVAHTATHVKPPAPCVNDLDTTCSICMSNDIADDNTSDWVITQCKHVFHASCIARTRAHGHTTCPMCRAPIN
jgi:hypothetical protein